MSNIQGFRLVMRRDALLPPAYAVEVMFSLCVCLSVCLSVWAITFEGVDIETF